MEEVVWIYLRKIVKHRRKPEFKILIFTNYKTKLYCYCVHTYKMT